MSANSPQAEKVTLSLTEEQAAHLMQMGAQMYRDAQKDPQAEARKEAQRERLRGEQERTNEVKRVREQNCSHLREDLTSAIAWMQTSDGLIPGTCQHCNSIFTVEHPKYAELRRIPTHKGSIQYL